MGHEEALNMPESQRVIAREVGKLISLAFLLRGCLRQVASEGTKQSGPESFQESQGSAALVSTHVEMIADRAQSRKPNKRA